ncbi:MAG: NAD(P)-dependent oxidoreductase [Acidobacteria bacterium]|nr:NAD(P)-dependent oxidoreductase [Acidobacteriota bacterium]
MKIGFIGLGVMGAPMAGHLHRVFGLVGIHTRTRSKADPLLSQGVAWFETPQALAQQCDVVCTMLGFPPDVHAVYFGPEGILAGAHSGLCCIDFTTTRPQLAKDIASQLTTCGGFFFDAPVSGGDVGARQATLSIMVGGSKTQFPIIQSLLEAVGQKVVYQGHAGAGQHTKMTNQIVIAGTMIGVCEALLYGVRAGLDLETMLSSIRPGAAGCWTLENLAPRILKQDFEPGFYIEHFVKDMEIALNEASRLGICLPGLALVHQFYRAAQNIGLGKKGTQALYRVLESLASPT